MYITIVVYIMSITLLAAYSTAAYFHTMGECILAYVIALGIQIPLGVLLMSSNQFVKVKEMIGLSPVRHHTD
eukprot:CAMPEP_0184858328 /NCGR_PEP_ID=MMETSP0580-20130426/3454_1 /TAXON_ID=1118495 /ORGANISM="Dactyliosolen fragilissimus" /LENGTH=71 /DNA_ID=CAMNT_0027354429 /DNA_START=1083 /DNA_END=1298 /DNA_ORIENTATION=+